MQRRRAIKQLGLGLGIGFSLPSWATAWTNQSLAHSPILMNDTEAILAEIVETIIPQTDSPGAKSLGVHKLIQKIVADCQPVEVSKKLEANLLKINELAQKQHAQNFVSLGPEQKLALIQSMEKADDADLKAAFGQLKRMTIDGYMRSEYFMTQVQKWEWAPARFYGCIANP